MISGDFLKFVTEGSDITVIASIINGSKMNILFEFRKIGNPRQPKKYQFEKSNILPRMFLFKVFDVTLGDSKLFAEEKVISAKTKKTIMADRLSDPIGRLMGLRYKSHPWHGVFIGKDAPENVTAFIEVVPTDTVKYEIDKECGYLRLDRPQKYSNVVPALYGFIPQTLCGSDVGAYCMMKTGMSDIKGDGDPIDICVLTEKTIAHGDILVDARPIGGFRMIDGNEADDKIIAVLTNDVVYSEYKNLSDLPDIVVERLKHYFLTYKDMPGKVSNTEITHTYGVEEAMEVIQCSISDYHQKFDNIGILL